MRNRSKKRKKMAIESLVGRQTTVSGDVEFTGGFHVDGYVKGSVVADGDDQATLSVSEQGCVEGNVSVPHLFLNGTVKGDVAVSERVELGNTARVVGNVYYKLIEMAIGAEINGKLIHQPDGGRSGGSQADKEDEPDLASAELSSQAT